MVVCAKVASFGQVDDFFHVFFFSRNEALLQLSAGKLRKTPELDGLCEELLVLAKSMNFCGFHFYRNV